MKEYKWFIDNFQEGNQSYKIVAGTFGTYFRRNVNIVLARDLNNNYALLIFDEYNSYAQSLIKNIDTHAQFYSLLTVHQNWILASVQISDKWYLSKLVPEENECHLLLQMKCPQFSVSSTFLFIIDENSHYSKIELQSDGSLKVNLFK